MTSHSSLDEERLGRALAGIYDASADEDWGAALEPLLEAIDAHAADILVPEGILFRTAHAFPDDVIDDYLRYYHTVDVRAHRSRARPGEVLTNSRLGLSDREYSRTEFHSDLMSRTDIFYALGFSTSVAQGSLTVVAHRRHARGEFEDEAVRWADALRPHLCRAILLSRRLRRAEQLAEGAKATLDSLSTAVVLFDLSGRVRLVNRAAERILGARDALWLSPDGPATQLPSTTARIREEIARAAALACGDGLGGEGVVRLPRRHGSPLTAVVAPLPSGTILDAPGGCAVAVYLLDPDSAPPTTESRLMRLYGFTRAEAALAILLLAGDTLDEAAERRSVGRETVRAQLASLMRKTDTSRQSHLLRKLALEAARLPEP